VNKIIIQYLNLNSNSPPDWVSLIDIDIEESASEDEIRDSITQLGKVLLNRDSLDMYNGRFNLIIKDLRSLSPVYRIIGDGDEYDLTTVTLPPERS